MLSTSWEHETLYPSALVRLHHSAKTSTRQWRPVGRHGRRKPPYATGRNRESGVGPLLGVVRW